jgi:hypothetical protein
MLMGTTTAMVVVATTTLHENTIPVAGATTTVAVTTMAASPAKTHPQEDTGVEVQTPVVVRVRGTNPVAEVWVEEVLFSEDREAGRG